MARFVFKLEGVLRQREVAEDEKKRLLAAAHGKYALLQKDLEALDQTVQSANGDLRDNHLVGKIDMNFIAAHRRFIQATQRQAIAIVQKMAVAQRELDEARRQLAEAAKQRKIIEKLKEKQKERWTAEINRKELNQLDEIGMQLSYREMTGQ